MQVLTGPQLSVLQDTIKHTQESLEPFLESLFELRRMLRSYLPKLSPQQRIFEYILLLYHGSVLCHGCFFVYALRLSILCGKMCVMLFIRACINMIFNWQKVELNDHIDEYETERGVIIQNETTGCM